ncbi:hypothetical protein CGP82_08020, partial [Campylobacter sp. LR185c]
MNDLKFIAARIDGLGGRLYTIVNAMILAYKSNCQWGFCWHDYYKNAIKAYENIVKEEDFFSKDFVQKYSFTKSIAPGSPLFFQNGKKSIEALIKKPWDKEFGYYAPLLNLNDQLSDISEKEYKNLFEKFFKEIDFCDEIKENLKKIDNKAKDLKDFVAIHFRGKDIIYQEDVNIYCLASMFYKLMPIEIVKEIIENEKDKNIILFSDMDENARIVCDDFAKKGIKIQLASEILKAYKTKRTKYDLYEVYFLSKARTIYRGGSSLFSRFATMIGKAKSVDIYADKKETINIILKNHNYFKTDEELRASSLFVAYMLAKGQNFDKEFLLDLITKANAYKHTNVTITHHLIIMLGLNEKFDEIEQCLQKQDLDKFSKSLFLKTFAGIIFSESFDIYLKAANANRPLICFIASKIYAFKKDLLKAFQYAKMAYDNGNLQIIKELYLSLSSEYALHLKQELNVLKTRLVKPENDINTYDNAKNRIKNHLAYKFGRALIENSKSIKGYIKLPFI